MTVDVELAGRRHALDVRRVGGRWLVTIDGRQVAARVTDTAGRWSLLMSPPEDGPSTSARSYEITIEPTAGGELVVHVNGHAMSLAIGGAPAGGRRRRAKGDGIRGGPAAVVAPMPGRIVKVLVKPGDVVEPRQGLVVVEAMKMENELRASRHGTVTDVRVKEGMSVEANAVLVVIG